MKPIIIKPNEEGLICFTEEELQKLVDDVYAQGKADGVTYIPYTYPSNPYNPLTYVTWDGTKTAPVPSYGDKWTCSGTNVRPITTDASASNVYDTVNPAWHDFVKTKTILNENK